MLQLCHWQRGSRCLCLAGGISGWDQKMSGRAAAEIQTLVDNGWRHAGSDWRIQTEGWWWEEQIHCREEDWTLVMWKKGNIIPNQTADIIRNAIIDGICILFIAVLFINLIVILKEKQKETPTLRLVWTCTLYLMAEFYQANAPLRRC